MDKKTTYSPAATEQAILRHFAYEPTASQSRLIADLSVFLCSPGPLPVFVIRGYAGTGKTTLVSSLVKVLPQLERDSVLLAPTGRAAKVLATYTGRQAHTIHRKIYRVFTGQEAGMKLSLQTNPHRDTLFIVDEASMITDSPAMPGEGFFGGNRLLEDLFAYISQGQNCSLILIGDTAQLPPVGTDESPALSLRYLKTSYHIQAGEAALTDVVRQAAGSGILINASLLRSKISGGDYCFPFFSASACPDVHRVIGHELEEALYEAYSASGKEETLIICRSNKRAAMFNREIRNCIHGFDSEIAAGDILMAVRNNYFWLPPESPAGFIANGDLLEVLRIRKFQDIYGFRFADVQVRLTDFPGEKDHDIKIMLDTLGSDSPSLPWKEYKKLFDEIMLDYTDIPGKARRVASVKANPFFNALQVKYAYALTCHKAQGGQWEQVFVEYPYNPEEKFDLDFMRWLYTAVTRATQKLYLVGYPDKAFSDG